MTDLLLILLGTPLFVEQVIIIAWLSKIHQVLKETRDNRPVPSEPEPCVDPSTRKKRTMWD